MREYGDFILFSKHFQVMREYGACENKARKHGTVKYQNTVYSETPEQTLMLKSTVVDSLPLPLQP